MTSPKPLSPHVGFYRSFGRPLAKSLLISYCVYQLGMYTWNKLESNEMKQIKQNELDTLTRTLKDLNSTKHGDGKP